MFELRLTKHHVLQQMFFIKPMLNYNSNNCFLERLRMFEVSK